MAFINPSVPKFNQIPSKEFRELISELQSSTAELVFLFPTSSSDSHIEQSGIEMILLVLSVKSLLMEEKGESTDELWNVILDELPLAISHQLEEDIIEAHCSIRVFFGERMIFYKQEFEGLLHERDKNENDKWVYGVSDCAYIAIGEPLSDSGRIGYEDLMEFSQFVMSEENLHLPFITKVLNIASGTNSANQFESYNSLIKGYLDKYQRESGEIKYKQILTAVLSSNKSQKALVLLGTNQSIPSAVDIISIVMSLTYFLFAKKSTIAVGSVILLHTWHTEINLKQDILNDNELSELFVEVVQKSMKMM